MKKIVSLVFTFAIVSVALAQNSTDPQKINLVDRASDHLMIQLSTDHWTNMPDTVSVNQKGFSRGIGIYFMIDKPFKSNPKYSVAFGLGVGNSNIFFEGTEPNLTSISSQLPFPNTSTTDHFKKYKLSTSYLEVPVELRYTAHPEKENKSFKAAIGIKTGLILDAHTKGKDLLDQAGNVISDYTQKESSTNFFSTARLVTTARIGYGVFSIFGNYQITSLLKPGAGANIQFFQVGLGISGL